MPALPSGLTGVAGEHYVAYRLSLLGIVAALPRGGAMGVDILASNQDGTRTVAIQVKTTEWAARTRGRGDKKEWFQLQFPLGHKSARVKDKDLIFAFVDLRGLGNPETEPDVYLVPSEFVEAYCRDWVDTVKMVRLHISIQQMEQFKNNWSVIIDRLSPPAS